MRVTFVSLLVGPLRSGFSTRRYSDSRLRQRIPTNYIQQRLPSLFLDDFTCLGNRIRHLAGLLDPRSVSAASLSRELEIRRGAQVCARKVARARSDAFRV